MPRSKILTKPIDRRTRITRVIERQLAIPDAVIAGWEEHGDATTGLTAMLGDVMGETLDGGARGALFRVLQARAHARYAHDLVAVIIPPRWIDAVKEVRQLRGGVVGLSQTFDAAPTVDTKGTSPGEDHEKGGEDRGRQLHPGLGGLVLVRRCWLQGLAGSRDRAWMTSIDL